mgnify:CR=1 FL=1|jgi:hypothetical protein
MNKPFKYTIVCTKTQTVKYQTNQTPLLYELQTYEPTEIEGQLMLKQTKIAYIDTRYKAKLRLYKYVMFKKYGVKL